VAGRWQTGTRLVKLLTEVFELGVIGLLLIGHNAWLAERGVKSFIDFVTAIPGRSLPDAETVQILVMQAVRLGLTVALVVTLVEVVKYALRLARGILNRGTIMVTFKGENLGN
jgi:hypothetical protein